MEVLVEARPALEFGSEALRLSDVLAALTRALDLTEGHIPGHAARSCFLSMLLAEEMALPRDARSDLFYGALLKDAGCSSNAARVCEIYAADDIQLKHDYERIDSSSLLACARYVIRHTGPTDPWSKRLLRLGRLAAQGRRLQREVEVTRCERGAEIARKLGFGDAVAAAIYSVGESWDGAGQPEGRAGESIPLLARIIAVAQTAEVFSHGGAATALRIVRERRGRSLDPATVDAFSTLATRGNGAIWDYLAFEDSAGLIRDLEPTDSQLLVDDGYLDRITTAFAQIIDAKSPFTGSHSFNVALVAEAMSRSLGLSEQQGRTVRWASLIHDLGKLGISNRILDKPGPLDDQERLAMRKHPEYTLEIVARVPALREVAELGARHHERVDGRGYFRGLKGEQLTLSARTIAVADVWEALTADRPYRRGMEPGEALSVMDGMVGHHLGREAYRALRDVI